MRTHRCRASGWFGGASRVLFIGALLWSRAGLAATDLADAQKYFRAGDYTGCIAAAEEAAQNGKAAEEWSLVQVQALLAVGRYKDAQTVMTAALKREPQSIRLMWLAREVAYRNGRPERAASLAEGIAKLVAGRQYYYREPPNLVIFGRMALLFGADPKEVLDKIYATVLKADANQRDAWLGKGELALDKHDFALAGETFEAALKQFPDDPDFHCGLARAHADGDHAQMTAALEAALRLNPRHVPSLLLQIESRIDAEDYAEADRLLGEVHAINPRHPDAAAYRAVLAHLRNDPKKEAAERLDALTDWAENPRVDFLIGEKLAQKYRFAEAAEHQRQALVFDPDYLPAKAELSNDLLRLGEETEGWQLAKEVNTKDAYDVAAFNVVALHDTMAKFATVSNEDFVVRMTAHEAQVYGPRVLELLGREKKLLVKKYGVELPRPVFVEIFADPKDFAVRTFGMPDVAGFLGVCFGRVVTANSPAANRGHTVNWETVLWHEFCHVVTLTATHNKMPRWLSEGISVYEERQGDPAWGQHLTVRYRELILGDEALTPVARLSGAFLSPKTSEHLQFAYYEASLVVEFIVERYGLEQLRYILFDLGRGVEINAALAAHTAPLPDLEKNFAAFAKDRAGQLAPKLTWDKPDAELLLPDAEQELAAWAKKHSDNYWALRAGGRRLIADKKWTEAKVPLARLVELFPAQRGEDSAWRLLASAHRALGETTEERRALESLVALDDAAPDACQRLIEIATEAKDWLAVAFNAQRLLGIDPLVPAPWRALAQASTATSDRPTAIAAWQTILQLDPANPADVHFHLAQLMHASGDPAAKRHLLEALEDTPRHREALQLLLTLNAAVPDAAAKP